MGSQRFLHHVQALRGLAILLVFVYHVREQWCPQGFLGVDVFFVLAGFLLVPGIFRKAREGSFTWAGYYRGKALRLLPALLVMLLVLLAAAVPLMLPDDLQQLGASALALLGGRANEHFGLNDVDYFAADVKESPLLHSWYICALLQMLLVAPLICVPLAKLRARWRYALLALPILGSLIIFFQNWLPSEWQAMLPQALQNGGSYGSVYYMTLGRVWELLAGAYVGLLPACAARHKRTALLLAGLGLVLLPAFWPQHASGLPLAVVLGTMLVIRYGEGTTLDGIFRNRILMWLGAVSYSLYLVHWPLLAIARYVLVRDFGAWECWLYAGLVLLPTWLMYHGVEQRRFRLRHVLLMWLTALGAAQLLWQTQGLRSYLHRYANAQFELPAYEAQTPAPADTWQGNYPMMLNTIRKQMGDTGDALLAETAVYRVGAANRMPDFLLLGDSYARALFPGMDIVGREENWSGLYFNLYVTPFWDRLNRENDCLTDRFTRYKAEALLQWLKLNPHLHRIILAQCWIWRFRPAETWSGERIEQEEVWARGEASLKEFCRKLQAMGKEIVLVMPTPEATVRPNAYVPSILKRHLMWYRQGNLPDLSSTKVKYDKQMGRVRALLERMAQEGYCSLVDPAPVLFHNGVFCPIEGKHLITWDHGHMTVYGAHKLVSGLRGALNTQLQPQPTANIPEGTHRKSPTTQGSAATRFGNSQTPIPPPTCPPKNSPPLANQSPL